MSWWKPYQEARDRGARICVHPKTPCGCREAEPTNDELWSAKPIHPLYGRVSVRMGGGW